MSPDRTIRQPADQARRLVLEQHIELRRLLTMGLVEVRRVMVENGVGHEPLRSLVGLIREVFVQHLVDEEALIVPILEDDLPIGPQRVEALREEHERQRRQLDTLCDWPEAGDDSELAERFEALATALLEDIAHEERELLIPEVIRDDSIVIDQCGG
jgi:hemerythrin-like domain-containing protein